ncbi:putative phytosulfokines 6 [Phtheirospermum japonicum]|uniref:Phytosulfokine n=1 Tax=Phtheirospermum japonicum TaxID=374723 RepID=A0A830CEK2_9LAMI|nr:putative phytosulfokines 6 [Phtheirospermum japonicum]
MNPNFHSVALLLLLFFLLSTSNSSARNLAAKEGEVDDNMNSMGSQEPAVKIGSVYSFDKLMGLDQECKNKDEECLKRRAIAEVHLDYIYTQPHKP